jgi:hypothetical protein
MRLVIISIIALAALTGCATRQPVWQNSQRIVTISGKDTAGVSQQEILQRMLYKSARVTIDHGFRYFAIIRPLPSPDGSIPLRPGNDLTIRILRQGETKYPAPGLLDAYSLMDNPLAERVSVKQGS